MQVVLIIAVIVVGYLSGSVNYAIIVTRLVAGGDIRELGNKNAGTANVARNVGKGWAAIVYFADVLKGFIPMLLTHLFLFTGGAYLDYLVVGAVGIAAIAGHCRPVFFGFRGGGGMATAMGVFLFFIPVEFVVCTLLSALFVMLFIKHAEFRVGRSIPITFVTATPFVTLALNWFVDIPLFAHISIGGHPWYILVVAYAISLFILGIHLPFVLGKMRAARESAPSEVDAEQQD